MMYNNNISERVGVVLSGCGTSGRLAFFVCRTFNYLCVTRGFHPFFHYLIAGGDKAIVAAQEAKEDDATGGREEYIALSSGLQSVLLIGITCCLSAPYVGGMLSCACDDMCVLLLLVVTLVMPARRPLLVSLHSIQHHWLRR